MSPLISWSVPFPPVPENLTNSHLSKDRCAVEDEGEPKGIVHRVRDVRDVDYFGAYIFSRRL